MISAKNLVVKMEDRVKGNSCIFCLFKFLNLFLILVGLGILVAGIYVCADDKSFNWYNGSFTGLGIITILVAIVGHKSKYSQGGMTFYCISLFLITLAMGGFTAGIIAYDGFSDSIGESNANAVRYSLLLGCIIMLVTFVLAVCYRRSIGWANFYNENDPKFRHNNVPLVSAPKTEKRREEMYAKYAELRNK